MSSSEEEEGRGLEEISNEQKKIFDNFEKNLKKTLENISTFKKKTEDDEIGTGAKDDGLEDDSEDELMKKYSKVIGSGNIGKNGKQTVEQMQMAPIGKYQRNEKIDDDDDEDQGHEEGQEEGEEEEGDAVEEEEHEHEKKELGRKYRDKDPEDEDDEEDEQDEEEKKEKGRGVSDLLKWKEEYERKYKNFGIFHENSKTGNAGTAAGGGSLGGAATGGGLGGTAAVGTPTRGSLGLTAPIGTSPLTNPLTSAAISGLEKKDEPKKQVEGIGGVGVGRVKIKEVIERKKLEDVSISHDDEKDRMKKRIEELELEVVRCKIEKDDRIREILETERRRNEDRRMQYERELEHMKEQLESAYAHNAKKSYVNKGIQTHEDSMEKSFMKMKELYDNVYKANLQLMKDHKNLQEKYAKLLEEHNHHKKPAADLRISSAKQHQTGNELRLSSAKQPSGGAGSLSSSGVARDRSRGRTAGTPTGGASTTIPASASTGVEEKKRRIKIVEEKKKERSSSSSSGEGDEDVMRRYGKYEQEEVHKVVKHITIRRRL